MGFYFSVDFRQSAFVVSVIKNVKGYHHKQTADRLVSARGQKMLTNFPKGLFQSEADKCFGICMLINPCLRRFGK
jgi:hypothetical protein